MYALFCGRGARNPRTACSGEDIKQGGTPFRHTARFCGLIIVIPLIPKSSFRKPPLHFSFRSVFALCFRIYGFRFRIFLFLLRSVPALSCLLPSDFFFFAISFLISETCIDSEISSGFSFPIELSMINHTTLEFLSELLSDLFPYAKLFL